MQPETLCGGPGRGRSCWSRAREACIVIQEFWRWGNDMGWSLLGWVDGK